MFWYKYETHSSSSIGRASVSKTEGSRFKSWLVCWTTKFTGPPPKRPPLSKRGIGGSRAIFCYRVIYGRCSTAAKRDANASSGNGLGWIYDARWFFNGRASRQDGRKSVVGLVRVLQYGPRFTWALVWLRKVSVSRWHGFIPITIVLSESERKNYAKPRDVIEYFGSILCSPFWRPKRFSK